MTDPKPYNVSSPSSLTNHGWDGEPSSLLRLVQFLGGTPVLTVTSRLPTERQSLRREFSQRANGLASPSGNVTP